jgi:GNAT superfamily N-acetyltransferase
MQATLRAANASDAQLIAELTRAAWAGKVAPSSSGHRDNEQSVRNQLLQGGGFLLFLDDQPIGSVRWLPLDDNPSIWEILRMAVLPAFRGQDLSRHLMQAIVQHAIDHQIKELRLAVRADQPRLLDLYATSDFVISPELVYSHANPAEPAPTVMRRQLK